MSNTLQQVARQSRFAAIPGESIPRSKFPLEFRRLHTFNADDMVPIAYLPMEPGDDISCNFGSIVRLLSPTSKPMMDNLFIDWFVVFGAKRLLWNKFERFYGAKDNPDDSTDFTIPYLVGESSTAYTVEIGGVADGLSFPLGIINSDNVKVSCLLHRLYRLFWNQWVRDGVYQDSVTVSLGDGPDTFEDVDGLLKRGKRFDYFSSALDAPQQGAGVPIPWSNDGEAPVYGDGSPVNWENLTDNSNVVFEQTSGTTAARYELAGTANGLVGGSPFGGPSMHLYADVTAVSADLNALRTAIVLQQIRERDKRGGSRFTEIIRVKWNVVVKDERLQRIEYVAGGSDRIGAQNVVQTSPSIEGSPQGNLTAYMRGGNAGHFRYRAPEPGYLMVVVNVRTRLTYQQQLSRHLTRRTLWEFPDPLTMHLGETPVYQYEMYYPPAGADSGYMQEIWGWQEPWAVDRYTPSTVTGLFRSDAPGSLDNWHLAQDYSTSPTHDGEWVQSFTPVSRVIIQTAQPQFLGDFGFEGFKISSMPVYSTPGLNRI